MDRERLSRSPTNPHKSCMGENFKSSSFSLVDGRTPSRVDDLHVGIYNMFRIALLTSLFNYDA